MVNTCRNRAVRVEDPKPKVACKRSSANNAWRSTLKHKAIASTTRREIAAESIGEISTLEHLKETCPIRRPRAPWNVKEYYTGHERRCWKYNMYAEEDQR